VTEIDDTQIMALALERMSPEFSRAPQDHYRRLREACPVFASEGSVTIARHDLVEDALRHPEVFTSDWGDGIGLGNERPLIPLQIDPPKHKEYRKLLDPLFAPREMAKLEPDVARLTNEIIDTFADQGACDFNTEFAVPLPTTVFLRLLGLPIEERPLFLGWKDAIIRPPAGEDFDAAGPIRKAAADEMYAYFLDVLDTRERDPRDDLLTGFLQAEVEGIRLTREEILDICFLLLIAGLDTVTDALDCSFAFLARNPDHRRQIVEDPAVIPSAIEELLRWETVVPGVARFARVDTMIEGCPVHQGDMISVMLGAANVDPDAFPEAFTVDFRRDPNRHLAFGGGVHRCLGSHLARMELRVAFREWHRRIPEYRVPDGVELEYTAGLRQIEYLPLEFSPPGG
jgi:cytochrome P450